MKLWRYMILITTIIILFEIFGINITGLTTLLGVLGITQVGGVWAFNFSASLFVSEIFGSINGLLTLAGAVGGIIIGRITNATPENYIILPFITGTLSLYLMGFTNIIKWALTIPNPVVGIPIFIIFGVLAVGYIITLVEFFRGTD